jgi:hypothetical protein
LSTTHLCGKSRVGSGTDVASTDDIHTPVENFLETPNPHNRDDREAAKPPGEFISDELEAHTKRFVENAKGLAQRRRDAATQEKTGPPPPTKTP